MASGVEAKDRRSVKLVGFKAPPEEYAAWKAHAEEIGSYFSEWARNVLNEAVGKQARWPRKRMRRLTGGDGESPQDRPASQEHPGSDPVGADVTSPSGAPAPSPAVSLDAVGVPLTAEKGKASVREFVKLAKQTTGKCDHLLPSGTFCKRCGVVKG